ncbi:hypothetical protein [Nocardia farcinica]|uniref:hypothetical protein n=1 Tax=Nocardia farcinica TaxID=37329 RepID=UPI0024560F2E|nr:hypothetical protein [Nocardia farcinica]
MVVGAPLTAAFARGWPPRRGLPAFVLVFAVVQVAGALADHLRVLVVTRVVAAFMATAALVNAGTCGAFTFLTPLITGPVGLSRRWIPVALMLFGLGSCLGVTAAGRLADRWPGQVVAVGGPPALLGRLATAATTHPTTLLVLVAGQGALSFAVGSTLVARVLGEATGAPTMGGAYATAALNLGAALGPIAAAATLSTGPAERGPFVAAAVAVALAPATVSATRVRAADPNR